MWQLLLCMVQPSDGGASRHLLQALPTPGLDSLHQCPWHCSMTYVLAAAAPCRHLTWLVVDEADRLLRQDYQGWLPYVLQQLPGEHQVPPAGSAPPTDGLLGPSLALSSTNCRWDKGSRRPVVEDGHLHGLVPQLPGEL